MITTQTISLNVSLKRKPPARHCCLVMILGTDEPDHTMLIRWRITTYPFISCRCSEHSLEKLVFLKDKRAKPMNVGECSEIPTDPVGNSRQDIDHMFCAPMLEVVHAL